MSAINDLIAQIENEELRNRIAKEVSKLTKQKKFGLVFEEHLPECTPLYDIPVKRGSKVATYGENNKLDVSAIYTVMSVNGDNALCLKRGETQAAEIPVKKLVCVAEFGEPIYPYLKPLDSVCNAPDSDLWHTLIEADNYHALQLLEYLYAGKVDCIYIDPPYNTGARDWKYNNDYVDSADSYRHSKWLSMMEKRLKLAKRLLSQDGVLIVTIDDNEYAHLSLLLEEVFPQYRRDTVCIQINPRGPQSAKIAVTNEFAILVYTDDTAFFRKKHLGDDVSNLRKWGGTSTRYEGATCFYPIILNSQYEIVGFGDVLPDELHPTSEMEKQADGTYYVWPIDVKNTERKWRYARDTIESVKHRLVVEVKKGRAEIFINREDEALKTMWVDDAYNAEINGTKLLTKTIGKERFSYPKSLYAVSDMLKFFVSGKPNALILDFFAGSGTTLHAVNLLNAEDGGNRRCIMVTNNEISEAEEKAFTARGIQKGDEEWEAKGIARYVTWPRTVCSIEGHDVNGNPLKGNYIGSDIPMADGFKANAAFFKLGFLDKTRVSLGMQFKEMLPTLWMKAGAHGKCPEIEDTVPDMLILPENKMAVLVNENEFSEFAVEIEKHPEIKTVYLVTDYENSFVYMTQALKGKTTYQLYRDYLDNFRINAGRNAR